MSKEHEISNTTWLNALNSGRFIEVYAAPQTDSIVPEENMPFTLNRVPFRAFTAIGVDDESVPNDGCDT